MVWLTVSLLRLARNEELARASLLHTSRLKLAVWRIDSFLSPVLAQEAARPHFHYRPFYTPAAVYTKYWEELLPGEIFVPSPLLHKPVDWMKLHFQVSSTGKWSSPQVPVGNMLDMATRFGVGLQDVDTSATALEYLSQRLSFEMLQEGIASVESKSQFFVTAFDTRDSPAELAQQVCNDSLSLQESDFASRLLNDFRNFRQQVRLFSYQTEFLRQTDLVPLWVDLRGFEQGTVRTCDRFTAVACRSWLKLLQSQGEARVGEGAGSAEHSLPAPCGSERFEPCPEKDLLLVRWVELEETKIIQGIWLDWPRLKQLVEAEVKDIFPNAQVLPRSIRSDISQKLDRALTVIPAILEPGAAISPESGGMTSVAVGLVLCWVGFFVVAAAVGFGLYAVLDINKRRLDFVSAVTHELRTPLSTFQMYSEMLAEGMVSNEEQRRQYYHTLQEEALRLSHLVQNVLDYARLEDRRWKPNLESISVEEIINGIRPLLESRCKQAEMTLEVEMEALPARRVMTDVNAVCRIIHNLVDNACKYAGEASDRRVHLRVAEDDTSVSFEVSDHGEGVQTSEVERIFSPFYRGKAGKRAVSGVGLGLTLARRWARELGGDLFVKKSEGGATFMLRLPAGREQGEMARLRTS